MLVWMVCAMVPGVGLCIAGLLAEQATHQRHLPSRWVWIAAMSLSIMLPIAGPSLLGVAPARLPLPSRSWCWY
jgi:hypothetical protein